MNKLIKLVVALVLYGIAQTPITVCAEEAGIFLRDEPDCRVRSVGDEYLCRKDTIIYAGDLILSQRKPASFAIQWRVRSAIRLKAEGDEGHRVLFSFPKQEKGLFCFVSDLFKFTRRAALISNEAVTRGDQTLFKYKLPEDGATLLPGENVTFSWCLTESKQLLVKDAKGHQIVSFNVPEGKSSLMISVEKLSLSPHVSYVWEVDGVPGSGGKISLLTKPEAATISGVLKQIDESDGDDTEKKFKKVAFLEFITQNEEVGFSLGWLQGQLLESLPENLSPEDAKTRKWLEGSLEGSFCG